MTAQTMPPFSASLVDFETEEKDRKLSLIGVIYVDGRAHNSSLLNQLMGYGYCSSKATASSSSQIHFSLPPGIWLPCKNPASPVTNCVYMTKYLLMVYEQE